MNYFLFNNEIYLSDGNKIEIIEKSSHPGYPFDRLKEAHICVVDTDVLIASASENALDKKDGILAKKFFESYQGDYVLQDEKISRNIFQVIGIKSEKVKEVYSLIPSEKVITFVPYAVAIRSFLAYRKTSLDKPVVFLDDLGNEKLITVFEGLKFSRTRTIFNNKVEQVLPEIKRSVINFEKKLEEQKDKSAEGYFIITNNEILAKEIKEMEKDLIIEFLDSVCPALDGLKIGEFNLKYVLPEDVIKKRREGDFRKKTQSIFISGMILGFGMLFYFYNQINLKFAKELFEREQNHKLRLETGLNKLDPLVYRSLLKQQKRINYPLVYLNIANSVPVSFETYSFAIYNKGNIWSMEEYLSTSDDELFDSILPTGVLKRARIKDFLVNNRPGKYLRIEL